MRTAKTNIGRLAALAALSATLLLLSAGMASGAVIGPRLEADSISNTTAQPGDILDYKIQVTNRGDQPLVEGEAVEVALKLPPGLTVSSPSGPAGEPGNPHFITSNGIPLNYGIVDFEAGWFECTGADGSTPLAGGESEVRCVNPAPSPSLAGRSVFGWQAVHLPVDVAASGLAEGQVLSTEITASGGGSPTPFTTVDTTRVAATPPAFGIDAFDGLLADEAGKAFTQAGGHPDSFLTKIELNTLLKPVPQYGPATPVAAVRDMVVDLPPGLLGNPTVAAQCTAAELARFGSSFQALPLCPTRSQVGTIFITVLHLPSASGPYPLFNMEPPSGSPARLGFSVLGTTVAIDTKLRSDGDYGLTLGSRNVTSALAISGSVINAWGTPSDPSHDYQRACPGQESPGEGGPTCPSSGAEAPFMRLPTACTAPGEGLTTSLHTDSWQEPAAFDDAGLPDLSDPNWQNGSYTSHETPGLPYPGSEWGEEKGPTGCEDVPVKGKLTAQPTSIDTETSSGLVVHVEVPNPGLDSPTGIASSDLENVKVTLPQGMTINPSQAEGLGACSPARYESTELSFHPDGTKGCPADSKIGSVEVHTPLLSETIPGDVFVAKPFENPFNSLLALYIVLAEPQRGILVKLPGEIRTNEQTGRIEAEFSDLPQTPFSSFDFHFREGARAPLITPPTCGTYTTETEITGWSSVDPETGDVAPEDVLHTSSSFQITRGIGGGPCPPGGVPGFKPGFSAGSINNNAGSYSPFTMRLTRNDGEQDMTRFSSILPPGVLGKLAGVDKCPEAAIAAAKAKTGLQEKASPSCPANSQIGRTLAGAGVGSVLTYVPGELYLGGPFHGDPLSVIAITPAVAGPFDVGTVVVREALTLNPETAEVEVDGAASDPIPHILRGIPLKLRDLRVYVDRPEFTLNPTSCDPSATDATLFGTFADVFNPADDVPVALSDRYQAANCQNLGFKPRLSIKLEGGTRRGAHPALRAVLNARPGDANIAAAVVKLPRSAFLEQAHIRTICTRVQFAAGAGNGEQCPKGARYGYARAFTPLLDQPVEGPVYLRSSNHQLPDLVAALHGLVDVNVVGRIDSFKGGIRSSFDSVPDAPVTKFVLTMQGGRKGLVVNSRELCEKTARASARFTGQNGKVHGFRPLVRPECGARHKGRHKRHG